MQFRPQMLRPQETRGRNALYDPVKGWDLIGSRCFPGPIKKNKIKKLTSGTRLKAERFLALHVMKELFGKQQEASKQEPGKP